MSSSQQLTTPRPKIPTSVFPESLQAKGCHAAACRPSQVQCLQPKNGFYVFECSSKKKEEEKRAKEEHHVMTCENDKLKFLSIKNCIGQQPCPLITQHLWLLSCLDGGVSSSQRDCMARKPENIYCLALYGQGIRRDLRYWRLEVETLHRNCSQSESSLPRILRPPGSNPHPRRCKGLAPWPPYA